MQKTTSKMETEEEKPEQAKPTKIEPEEPTNCELPNPCRVLRKQMNVIEFIPSNRYQPVIKVVYSYLVSKAWLHLHQGHQTRRGRGFRRRRAASGLVDSSTRFLLRWVDPRRGSEIINIGAWCRNLFLWVRQVDRRRPVRASLESLSLNLYKPRRIARQRWARLLCKISKYRTCQLLWECQCKSSRII